MSELTYKKAVQHRGYRSAAFMLLSLAICVLSSGRQCMLLHNSHHSLSNGYKYIYFCVLMFGLSLILASKQTLGPEFKGICHASLLQPHPRDESEGHETGKADKNKSLINIRALNAKPFLFRLCLRALWEWQFFFLICAHIVEKLQANVLAIDHSTNRCWRCISKVTAWMQTFSTTVQWLIWLKDVKCSVTVCALFVALPETHRRWITKKTQTVLWINIWLSSLSSKKGCEAELGRWQCLLSLGWMTAIHWAGPKMPLRVYLQN